MRDSLKKILVAFFLISFIGNAQQIPTQKVIEVKNLTNFLNKKTVTQINSKGKISEEVLSQYFREKFSERYFYNWENFEDRFKLYKEIYPNNEVSHTERALDHISKYSPTTQWVLPFDYLNGEPVNAYALRHLARQHKMVDIAYYYNYKNNETEYLDYFTDQMASLNRALELDKYEKIEDGNGVYEAFRSGYRVLNWLQIHNIFLGEKEYSDKEQLTTIASLLQHGAHLYKNNPKFHPGNHQTRGLSALAMISILLRDFEGTDVWYQHSMKLLEEHLSKEINDDGFQFERSIHYHMSDIGNYYYVYQLAKINNIEVNSFWEEKLKSLFTTLTKIAYPDKSAPVLQDDTDDPWAEKNNISGAITLGYLLFEDKTMGYFANDYVEAKMYWYLSDKQLEKLTSIEKETPAYKSLEFPTTGYYVMREGWKPSNNMMIITAGLDADKPDHQHGDMLGVQAIANGKIILPNYQVRYSLSDLELFKNSMVKNVALVDEELQGKKYTSNKGGSGFGKFKELPNPTVAIWETGDNFDLFVGSHNGFENIGVKYSRQVINIKNDFWIVKDNFSSEEKHVYKQVWQGHYSLENKPNLLRATFDDATGFDIFQLKIIDEVAVDGARGKHWAIQSKNSESDFSFVTVLFPYKGYDNRINETSNLKGWILNNSQYQTKGKNVISLTKENESFFFGVEEIMYKNDTIKFSKTTDVYLEISNNTLKIKLIGIEKDFIISVNGKTIEMSSGDIIEF